jgi:hypothetical protein
VLNARFGYQLMTAIKLGVDSYRQGRVMMFDTAAERLTEKAMVRPAYEGDGKNRPDGRGKRG